jgi:hypothetical protein
MAGSFHTEHKNTTSQLYAHYKWPIKTKLLEEGTREDQWRDFWMCGTRMGQQVVQLHDS